jgi:hypothetical protein
MSRYNGHGGRRELAEPHLHQPLDERLERAGAIDLKGNHVRESLGNGYSRIVPVDPNKLFKAKR